MLVSAALTALFVPIGIVVFFVVRWSTIVPTWHWIIGDDLDRSDSWTAMFAAMDWVRANTNGLYAEVFFNEKTKFQYPPSSLLPLVALEAAGVTPSYPMLNTFNRLLVAVNALTVGLIAWKSLSPLRTSAHDRLVGQLTPLYAVGATLLFYPVAMAFSLGQVQVWINTLFALSCLAWLSGRLTTAGVMIGLICLIKPQFGLFAIWGLVRREWGFLAGLVATGAVGLLVSVLVFGLPDHLDYLRVLSFLASHGEAYYPNQSVNGLLNRLVGHDPEFDPNGFPPFHPFVYYGTMITSAAIILAGLFACRRRKGQPGLLGFQFAALAFTIASPVAWEHHYGVVAPMLASAFCFVLLMPRPDRLAWLLGLAMSYTLVGNYFGFTNALTGTPAGILQSYGLFGGLLLLVLLWRLAATDLHESIEALPEGRPRIAV